MFLGSQPERGLEGIDITVDLEKHDAGIKLLIGCTTKEEQVIDDLLNDGAMRVMKINRLNSSVNL